MSNLAQAQNIDVWVQRVLTAIDECRLDVSFDYSLLQSYEQLAPITRRSLGKFCPFRYSVLCCLRSLALMRSEHGSRHNIYMLQARDSADVIAQLLHLSKCSVEILNEIDSPIFFHSVHCTIAGNNLQEVAFYKSLLAKKFVSDLLDRALEENCSNQISNVRAYFGGFVGDGASNLDDALTFIRSYLPTGVIDTIFANVSLIFFVSYPEQGKTFEHGLTSAHHPLVPNSFFLSNSAFSQIGNVVELIYHEALHNKLETIALIKPIYRTDFHPLQAPRFTRTWGNVPTDNEWSFDRAFHAHYVYSNLADMMYFFVEAPELPNELRAWGEYRLDTTVQRGKILAEWLLKSGPKFLTPEGLNIVTDSHSSFFSRVSRTTV